jgi:hypothetical protein
MRRSLIEEDNVQALGLGLAAVPQQDGAARGLEAGELPPAGVARGGFHRRREPVRFIERFDDLEGLHTIARDPATHREVQAQAAFVLAKHPHGLHRALAA